MTLSSLSQWFQPEYCQGELAFWQKQFSDSDHQKRVRLLNVLQPEKYRQVYESLTKKTYFLRQREGLRFSATIPMNAFLKHLFRIRDWKNLKGMLYSKEFKEWSQQSPFLEWFQEDPSRFAEFCAGEVFRAFVEQIVQRPLQTHLETIPRTFFYTRGDFLEKHTDIQGNRAIAYIFHFSPEWTEKEGGRLQFFKSLEEETPYEEMVPQANSLILLDVSVDSYHRVERVESARTRYSMTGWFYEGRSNLKQMTFYQKGDSSDLRY